MKRLTEILAFGIAVCALMAPTMRAQELTPFFVEDFEDGDAADGIPVTWFTAEGGTGEVSDGSFTLITTRPSFASVMEFPSVSDVSIRVQVRALRRDPGEGFAGVDIFARSDPSRAWSQGYWVTIGAGVVAIGDGAILAQMETPLDLFTSDLSVQFDVVGNKLSLTVWRTGAAKPVRPQLTATSSRNYPAGLIGFATEQRMREISVRSFAAYRIGDSVLPTLRYKLTGGYRLQFTVPPGYVLQSSSAELPLQWTDRSEAEVPMSDPSQFFRLRSQ